VTDLTDTIVYASPAAVYTEEPESKKRKRTLDTETTNGISNQALYTGQVKANNHLRSMHAEIKTECEELAGSCVSNLDCMFRLY
jgi:proteasome activator subunit 3 (PA28 gamma)